MKVSGPLKINLNPLRGFGVLGFWGFGFRLIGFLLGLSLLCTNKKKMPLSVLVCFFFFWLRNVVRQFSIVVFVFHFRLWNVIVWSLFEPRHDMRPSVHEGNEKNTKGSFQS